MKSLPKERKKRLPNGYWNIDNQRNHVDTFVSQYQVKDLHEILKLRKEFLTFHCGEVLLSKHKGNIIQLLSTTYPNYPWNYQPKKKLPRKEHGYWKSISTQRNFLDELSQKHSFTSMKEFTNYPKFKSIIFRNGGKQILLYYNFDVSKMLSTLYPEYQWDEPNNFQTQKKMNKGHWNSPENHRLFMNNLYDKLNLTAISDWDNVKLKIFRQHGGTAILKYYSWNFRSLLQALYPSYHWKKTTSCKQSWGFWKDENNRKTFLDQVRYQNSDQGDMVNGENNIISKKKIIEHGGRGFLKKFPSLDITAIIKEVYPDIQSTQLPKYCKYRNYLLQLQSTYLIQKESDWFRIEHSAKKLLKSLRTIHPTYHWKEDQFISKVKKTSQRMLFLSIKSLFPNLITEENYRHKSISFHSSTKSLEFDIFIPSLNIAFEYQGQHHFDDMPITGFANIEIYQERDNEKKRLCIAHSISLITIPFWWDKSLSSLQKEVNKLYI